MKSCALFHRHRWFPVGFCFLFGFQCLFAYEPENNFWMERRAARGVMNNPSSAVRDGPHQRFASLIDKIPRAEALQHTLSPHLPTEEVPPLVGPYKELLNSLSEKYGSVRKITLPLPRPSPRSNSAGLDPPRMSNAQTGKLNDRHRDRPGPTIILIQDVHQNFEAQNNIRSAVSDLIRNGRLNVVALEGATEEYHLQKFADYDHPDVVREVADHLLKENLITGPIHALLTTPGRLPRVIGIDDPAHYNAHVQSVRDSSPLTASAIQALQETHKKLDLEKSSVYSPELTLLDRVVEDFHGGKASLGVYVETLAQKTKNVFPAVQMFRRALQMEHSLDFKQVEKEKTRLIEKLLSAMTPREIESLAANGIAYRSGSLRFGEFFAGLAQLCRQKGISLGAYPAMDSYIRYVLLADGIDPEKLLHELTLLEKNAFSALAKTSRQKDLVARTRRWVLSRRLVDFSFTPPEWEEWQTLEKDKDLDLSTFESFYREARFRDEAMAENIVTSVRDGEVGVLIAGGFHAEGITTLLQRKGAAVISFVPKITRVDTVNGSGYLSVFCQEKTPLEKLFKGERLFLSVNPLKPEIRRIALPILVILSTLALGFLVDVPSTFSALGGMGTIQNIQTVPEAAQAVVAVGLASMAFYAEKRNGALHFSQTPRKPKMTAELKIKFLDPIREQAIYFFPIAIAIPALAATLINATLGGGLAVFVIAYATTGIFGLSSTVDAFLNKFHVGYSPESKSALRRYVFEIGLVSLMGFLLSILMMTPSGVLLSADPKVLLEWSPILNLKAIGVGMFIGNFLGIGRHMAHNIKTFPHYLHWITGGTTNTLLPLSESAAGPKNKVPDFASFAVNKYEREKEDIFKEVNDLYSEIAQQPDVSKKYLLVCRLLSFLNTFNPSFMEKYKNITQAEKLTSDIFLLRYVINISVFVPLGACWNDSPGARRSYINIKPDSWNGTTYLDENIWWVETDDDVYFGVFDGIGILSSKLVIEGRAELNLTLTDTRTTLKKTKKNQNSADSILSRYQKRIVIHILKGIIRTRLFYSDREFGYSPNSDLLMKTITKAKPVDGPTDLPSKQIARKSGPAFILSGAMLSALIEELDNLKQHPEEATAFLFFQLNQFIKAPQYENDGRHMAAKIIAHGNFQITLNPQTIGYQILAYTNVLRSRLRSYFYPLDQPLPKGESPGEEISESKVAQIPEIPTEVGPPAEPENPILPPFSFDDLMNDYPMDSSKIYLVIKLIEHHDIGKLGQNLGRLIDEAIKELESLPSEHSSRDEIQETIKTGRRLLSSLGSLESKWPNKIKEIKDLIDLNKIILFDSLKNQSHNKEELLLKYWEAFGFTEQEKRTIYKYITNKIHGLPNAALFDSVELSTLNHLSSSLGDSSLFPLVEGKGDILGNQELDNLNIHEFTIAIPDHIEKLILISDNRNKNNNYLTNAITQIIKEIRSAEKNQERFIIRNSRKDLINHRIRKDAGELYVFTQILNDSRTLVILWMGAISDAHDGEGASAELAQQIIKKVDGNSDEVSYAVFHLTNGELKPSGENRTYGELKSQSQRPTNSLLYLLTGNPWWGLIGAGVESAFLLLVGHLFGVASMGMMILPLFSLAHVWIFARQNPNQPVQPLAKTFFWHYILAVPYALVGVSGFQDMVGGESLTRVLAVAWHLLSDSYLMYQDDRQAKRAAQDTLRLLSPPTPSLQVEAILGLRAPWQGLVIPSMKRRGFEKAYLKELGRLSSLAPKGSYPKNPNALMGLLESRLFGIPVSGEAQRVHLNIVNENDLPDAIRSAQILKEWKSRGIQTPRLILGAANKVVLERLRSEAQAGVVDVLSQPVVDGEGTLRSRILLETLQKIPLPAAYRLTVNLSQTILPDRSDIENLPKGDLAKILREKLLALLRGDPVGPKEFRIQLEIAERLLENA